VENPMKMLKHYSHYFDTFDGVKIANMLEQEQPSPSYFSTDVFEGETKK
jgi:hypothetical protein